MGARGRLGARKRRSEAGGARGLLGWYVWGVMGAGAVALVWALRAGELAEVGVWELVLFVGLAGVLDVMVVPMAGGGGVAASFAVLFAGLLVLGPGPTAWVAALAGLWSEGVVRRRPAVRTGFNVSHSVVSLVAAGWVYGAVGGRYGRVELGQWEAGLAVVAAAVVLWVLETGWVAVAVGLERGGRMWRRVAGALVPMLTLDGALASVGLLLALLYQSRQELVGQLSWQGSLFLGAVVVVPCALLYYAYRLQGHLQEVYGQSLRTLGALVEAKVEGGRAGHGERVAKLAAELAERLELPPEQVRQIRYAGYLHDIGKVGVPTALLSRRGRRYRGEPEAVRLHPQVGAEILGPIRFLAPAAEMVRAHHERWDGLGYPEGMKQEQIPTGARLLALANAYVGMTYSALPRLSPTQAIGRLRQASGSRFDPRLVVVLASVLKRSGVGEAEPRGAVEFAIR